MLHSFPFKGKNHSRDGVKCEAMMIQKKYNPLETIKFTGASDFLVLHKTENLGKKFSMHQLVLLSKVDVDT